MDKLKWIIGAIVAVVVLVVGGTWVYINVIRDDPPPRLAFDADETEEPSSTTGTSLDDVEPTDSPDTTAPPTTQAGTNGIEGTWTIGDGSVVGYRVGEILFGQSAEGVGRTNEISGQMVIDGTTVTAADFEVDMGTFTSDNDRRDNQFRGRIMDAATYPTATLVLVEPIELGDVPDDLEVIEVTATVELTLRGTTRVVPVDIRARRNGAAIELDGSVLIVFAEWDIPNPSTVTVTTEDEGELEFVLVFNRA